MLLKQVGFLFFWNKRTYESYPQVVALWKTHIFCLRILKLFILLGKNHRDSAHHCLRIFFAYQKVGLSRLWFWVSLTPWWPAGSRLWLGTLSILFILKTQSSLSLGGGWVLISKPGLTDRNLKAFKLSCVRWYLLLIPPFTWSHPSTTYDTSCNVNVT